MDLNTLVSAALADDIGEGDWTTLWTVPVDARGEAVIVAKEPVTVAGIEAVVAVYAQIDSSVMITEEVTDGHPVPADGVILRLSGPTRSLLTGERVALNFLGHLTGIATLTRTFVNRISGTECKIIDTRKTTPGWRDLEKAAVRAGGGVNHRLGLHDMVLIKDNHAVACGGIAEAIRAVFRQNQRGLEVEAEVSSLAELELALAAGVTRILLDNMDNALTRSAVQHVRKGEYGSVVLEASGNMTVDRVRAVAETGVNLISVGALTHSAPCADLSLRMIA